MDLCVRGLRFNAWTYPDVSCDGPSEQHDASLRGSLTLKHERLVCVENTAVCKLVL